MDACLCVTCPRGSRRAARRQADARRWVVLNAEREEVVKRRNRNQATAPDA